MAPTLPVTNPFCDGEWFYNTSTGQIQHIHCTNVAEYAFFMNDTDYVRFKTEALAQAYKAAHPPTHKPTLTAPGNLPGDLAGSIPGAGTLTDLSGFLSALTERNTWIRLGEGALGLILIGIGIAAITRSQPIGKAAIQVASTAAKVV